MSEPSAEVHAALESALHTLMDVLPQPPIPTEEQRQQFTEWLGGDSPGAKALQEGTRQGREDFEAGRVHEHKWSAEDLAEMLIFTVRELVPDGA